MWTKSPNKFSMENVPKVGQIALTYSISKRQAKFKRVCKFDCHHALYTELTRQRCYFLTARPFVCPMILSIVPMLQICTGTMYCTPRIFTTFKLQPIIILSKYIQGVPVSVLTLHIQLR